MGATPVDAAVVMDLTHWSPSRAAVAAVVVVLLLQLVPQPVAASATCTNSPVPVVLLGSTYYIDNRNGKGDGLWIYRENGAATGYQRGGSILWVSDPCVQANADTLIAVVN